MPAPTISALTPAPNRLDPNFATVADAFLNGFPTLRAEINAFANYLNTTALVSYAFSDGTAAQPSLRFASDANTGIFRPSSDNIAFATAGAERLRVASDGKVGIGTSSPTRSVEIETEGTATLALKSNKRSAAGDPFYSLAEIDFLGSDTLSGNASVVPLGRIALRANTGSTVPGGELAFYTNEIGQAQLNYPTERMRITSEGHVGIGTDEPAVPFHIDTRGDSSMRVQSAGATYFGVETDGVSGIATIKVSNDDSAGHLDIRTGAATAVAMRVSKEGRVGIGTVSPAGVLEVNTGSSAAYFTRSAGNVATTPTMAIVTDSTAVRLGASGDSMRFQVGPTGTSPVAQPERMRITSEGNLAIGRTTAYAALDIETGENRAGRFVRTKATPSEGNYVLEVDGSAQTGNLVSAGLMQVRGLGGTALTIDGHGRVGVGTSAPGSALDVRGNLNSGVTTTIYNQNAGASAYAGLSVIADGNNFFTKTYSDASAKPNTTEFTSTASGGNFVFSPANSEAMRISSEGRVGIGSSAPVGKFEVSLGGSAAYFTRNAGEISAAPAFAVAADASSVRLLATGESLRFHVGGTGTAANVQPERARIDSGGNFLVGTTSVEGAGGATIHSVGYITTNRGVTSTADHAVFKNPNGQVGSITTNGSTTSFNTSSDYRLKEDLQDILTPAERLMQLKPVNVSWRADGTRSDTFIAHELAEVLPYAVTGEKDAADPDGNPEYQSVDYSKVVPLLTAALQEALTKIENLETRINAMES